MIKKKIKNKKFVYDNKILIKKTIYKYCTY